jgi:hypothetical protein
MWIFPLKIKLLTFCLINELSTNIYIYIIAQIEKINAKVTQNTINPGEPTKAEWNSRNDAHLRNHLPIWSFTFFLFQESILISQAFSYFALCLFDTTLFVIIFAHYPHPISRPWGIVLTTCCLHPCWSEWETLHLDHSRELIWEPGTGILSVTMRQMWLSLVGGGPC